MKIQIAKNFTPVKIMITYSINYTLVVEERESN